MIPTRELLKQQGKIARRLMAAIAMLLVAALMLGGTTYAWFVMSVAPEVREIKTTVGGNGYLEIALQSARQGGSLTRAEIKHEPGDSLLSVKDRNTRWGNVVSLTDYGLDTISLYPARLNVSTQTESVNTAGYLSIPVFGVDGRLSRLDPATFLTYSTGSTSVFTEGRTYGVNILGTVGSEVAENETVTYHYRRSMIRDEAAGYLEEYRTSLRNQVITLLEEQQVGIFNLLLRATQLLNSSGQWSTTNTWTADNVATAKVIIDRMITIVRNSEASLKWALLAEAIADETNYPSDDENAMAALGELYRNFQTYPLTAGAGSISIRSLAEENGYSDLVSAVDSIIRSENQLAQAKVYISNDDTISNACILIIDIQNTFLKNGTEIETDGPGTGNPGTGTPRTLYAKEGNTSYGLLYNYRHNPKIFNDYLYFVGATPGPSTGLFAIMANLLGDYEATASAYFSASPTGFYDDSNNGVRKLYTLYIRATGKNGSGSDAAEIAKRAVSQFNEASNRGVLGTVYDEIMAYDPGNAMISFSTNKANGSAFGYSVDLAFQSSESGNLLLQKEALHRILGVSAQEAAEMGLDGSIMGQGSLATFTLSGDLIGASSGIAKELISNIYIVLTDTDSGAILGIVAADETEVVLEQATVSLAVYEPKISTDGILSKGDKRSSNVITYMTAGQPTYITAIVFLNGDTLPSGAIAATQHPSLYGSINLQFSSSAELVPMNYSGFGN